VKGARGRLDQYAKIRNRIAHGQPHAIREFELAAMILCGRRNFGSRAGRFLRTFDTTVTPQRRWIESIAEALKLFAGGIV